MRSAKEHDADSRRRYARVPLASVGSDDGLFEYEATEAVADKDKRPAGFSSRGPFREEAL